MKKMTTIKLESATKTSLDAFRNNGETYDDAVQRLLDSTTTENDLTAAYKDRMRHHKDLIEDWDAVLGDDW